LFTAEVFNDGCCASKTCGDEEKPLPTGVVRNFYFSCNGLSLKECQKWKEHKLSKMAKLRPLALKVSLYNRLN